MPDAMDQVDDDGDIEEQHDDLDCCSVMKAFIDLHGDEGTGDDDGDPFSPAPGQPKAGAFDQEQACVEEADGAKQPDSVLRDLAGALDGVVEDAAAGIEAELQVPTLEYGADVGVDELESCDAGADKRNRFEQFEETNDSEPACVGVVHLGLGRTSANLSEMRLRGQGIAC